MRIAFFISSHGFGHAARACAVMQGLFDRISHMEFDIYTRTAQAFFDASLAGPVAYFDCNSDVGLLQSSPLQSDIGGSLPVINDFLDQSEAHSKAFAEKLIDRGTDLVLCDISPIGLLAADKAGLPSMLIENFTWDWIYAEYLDSCPAFSTAITRMQAIYGLCSYRIKTQPLCDAGGRVDLQIGPLWRAPRRSIASVRNELGVHDDHKLVLLTLGGVPTHNPFLASLKTINSVHFLITGCRTSKTEDNCTLMRNDGPLYLPDYLNACDAVIAKLGYSTVAETWAAGLPLMYITREDFRESGALAAFVDNNMQGIRLSEYDYASGHWLARVDELTAISRTIPERRYKALDLFADFVAKRFAVRT